jgi:cation transport regulator ChaC
MGETTWGVLFETDPESLKNIDKKEGVPTGVYRQIPLEVNVEDKVISNVISHEVIKKGIYRPSKDYLDVLLAGAVEHRLPGEYIQRLSAFRGQEVKKKLLT